MPCIVVKRGEYAAYDLLYKTYGRRLPVVWDRRRLHPPPGADGQSERERRNSAVPISWTFLNFVVAQDSKAK